MAKETHRNGQLGHALLKLMEAEVDAWRKSLQWWPLASLHVPLNSGALLLWWAQASSENTPGCVRTTLQPLQAVSVQPTSVPRSVL